MRKEDPINDRGAYTGHATASKPNKRKKWLISAAIVLAFAAVIYFAAH